MKISFKILRRIIPKVILLIFIILNILIADDPTVGLIQNDPAKSYNGYTLFAPNTTKTTYLIDIEGNLVNQWESEYGPGLSAYLLEDGTLLRSGKIEEIGSNPKGGFQKFNWEGELIWQFYYGTQHHDIEPMPNGNVLMVVNDRQTRDAAVQAGRDPNLISGGNQWRLRSLSILEIAQTGPETGTVVWQWNAWDHLIQDFDNSKNNFGTVSDQPELMDINFADDGGQDWLHTNSIAYNEDLDQIVVSNRGINEIWIVDHSTTTEEAAGHTAGNSSKGGDLLYRWGNPIAYEGGTVDDQLLFAQHDAHWVESGLSGAGNILIFNNGLGRPGGNFSSVDEIIPPVDGDGNYSRVSGSAFFPLAQTWIYSSDTPADFNSPRYGGSQRLPNGNTLICNSDKGEFLEITPAKEIVWKYINPVISSGALTQGVVTTDTADVWIINNQVFRSYRYGLDYPGLVGKDLTPGDPIELFPYEYIYGCTDKSADNYDSTATINNGSCTYLAVNDEIEEIVQFKLANNYPNPFNPSTNIEFSLTERTFVTITIYDLVGNTIKILANELMEPGFKTVKWDSRDNNDGLVSSGIYFYSLRVGQHSQTKKMMLLR